MAKSKKINIDNNKNKLTEAEKNYCVQRATGVTAAEAYKVAFATTALEKTQLYNRASRLDRKQAIIDTVKIMQKPAAKLAQAKTIATSELWDSSEKNSQLKELAIEIRQQIFDENGLLIAKNAEVYLKTMELSAKISGQLSANLNVKSEQISYVFNVNSNDMNDDTVIIEHQTNIE